MLNGKEGRLLRRNNDKDANMKINILLCDDDKDFLQRISDTVAGQPVPPGASICITKKLESCRDNGSAIIAVSHYVLGH